MTDPAVDGDSVYFGIAHDDESTLYALEKESGQLRWEAGHGVRVSTPSADGERVYAPGSQGGLYAFDPANGEERWSFTGGREGRVRTPPTLRDGTVYSGSYAVEAFGVDATSGDERWQTSIRSLVA